MREHADDDVALSEELALLAPLLDRVSARAPAKALVEQTLRLAAAELTRAPSLLPGVAAVGVRLPTGFGPELARLLASVLPALALGLGWAVFVLRLGPAWLGTWLPTDLALALVVAQGVAALSALGLVTASLPLVAHRRALLRTRGAIE
jgi:hypothetical protein